VFSREIFIKRQAALAVFDGPLAGRSLGTPLGMAAGQSETTHKKRGIPMNKFFGTMLTGVSLMMLLAAGRGNAQELAVAGQSDGDGGTMGSLSVSGAKAAGLIDALEAAGASQQIEPDASFLDVDAVQCSLALTGDGLVPSCTMEQPVGGGSHAIVRIDATGDEAQSVIDALKSAGVKGTVLPGATTYRADSIDCSQGFFTGKPTSSCTLKISGR
jgi:hypothetical protein